MFEAVIRVKSMHLIKLCLKTRKKGRKYGTKQSRTVSLKFTLSHMKFALSLFNRRLSYRGIVVAIC